MAEEKNNPLADFLYGITSSETKRQYIRKIDYFFDFMGLKILRLTERDYGLKI